MGREAAHDELRSQQAGARGPTVPVARRVFYVGAGEAAAEAAIRRCGGKAKVAIISLLADVDAHRAEVALAETAGFVRQAIIRAQETGR